MEVPPWIFEQPPGWVSWLVSGVTLLGFPPAFVGLVLAWVQPRRTVRAAEAAEKAARDTRDRLRSYDAAISCLEAIRLLREIKAALNSAQWESMLDRHEQLAIVLIQIKERSQDLVTEADRKSMGAMLRELHKIEAQIRLRSSRPLDTEALATLASRLQEQLNRLVEISARLHAHQEISHDTRRKSRPHCGSSPRKDDGA
ncbi:MAG: hypothetical protein GC160_11460 [Acidobacteria bacterium]|nr:hypothetical protein [Acidobacteriota bacterium]